MAASPPPISRVVWHSCWRLVPSRFPPLGLFDRVAAPEGLDIIFAIEALTNDRLLDESGDIAQDPPEDRISGPGTTPISVRYSGGECVAVFRPRALSPVRQGPHFCYVWSGEAVTEIYQKSHYQPGQSF